MISRLIYPGSFDPIHKGHMDIIQRCHGLTKEMIVAVLENEDKKNCFTTAERVEMIKKVLSDFTPRVLVVSFHGLLVDFAREKKATIAVRGLRFVSDFESEFQMAKMNRRLSGLETFFLPTGTEFSYISSKIVKEIAAFGGDVSPFVPEEAALALEKKFSKK